MNWSGILKVVLNLAGAFAAGYGTAAASGQTPKVAVGAGVIAAVTNQFGLHQTQPGAMQ